jgi:murein endopeptidase
MPRLDDIGQGCSPKGCLPDDASSASVIADSVIADGGPAEGGPKTRARAAVARRSVDGKSQDEIVKALRGDVGSLGSMTFGTATRGALLNAVRMPDDERWTLINPLRAWGTAETVKYLVTAIAAVTDEFPGSPRLFIGDISRPSGGNLPPHLSHQSGRDVDVGYFYKTSPAWYMRATARNLDRPRTWALIRTLIARTDVRYIFIDRRVQRLLRQYAEQIGEDSAWLESVFHGSGNEPPIILHEPGHDTHFHVRFYNPIAEDTGRRYYGALVAQRKLQATRYTITHRVKKGETLLDVAKRYGVSRRAIMKANNLKEDTLRDDKTYVIPRDLPVGPSEDGQAPSRRVPPPRPAKGAVAKL